MSHWEPDAQRPHDAARLLPIAAAVLLLPPFILVFTAPVLIFGIPLIVVYLFGVWAAVILGAWLLSRRHARAPDDPPNPSKAEADQPGQR